MPVLPAAVPCTVMVARVMAAPPRGTCCWRSTACRTTCPDGTADAVLSVAHPGNSTAVIVATDGLLRLTVIRYPEIPPGAESRTIGTDAVPPAAPIWKDPVEMVDPATPGASAQVKTAIRATRRAGWGRLCRQTFILKLHVLEHHKRCARAPCRGRTPD